MWSISELKERGRMAFRRNYWKCIFVALVIGLVSGGAAGNGANNNNQNHQNQYQPGMSFEEAMEGQVMTEEETQEQMEQEMKDLIVSGVGQSASIFNRITEIVGKVLPAGVTTLVSGLVFGVASLALTVMAVFWMIFNIIITNVLNVGGARFFVMNSFQPQKIGEILWGFRERRFKNLVITMFLRELYTVLWTLLFIIPGIIKSYEYRMIPYILAENPDMDRREVFARSKEMMMGQKMNAFVLDLSFFGWYILNALTLGCSGFFYSNPYKLATDAELFLTLNGGFDEYDGVFTQNDYQQRWQDAYDNGTVWEESDIEDNRTYR
ncbi:MAG: DUF975 family protein [Dorea sp.]|nr:DUF975 family protein [Dorea sp.]